MLDFLSDFFVGNAQDIISLGFIQRAFIAGVLVGITCSVLSVFVVLKKMAFIGQGISHAAFGGVALGLLLFPEAQSPTGIIHLIALVFCVGVALLIGLVSRRHLVSEDSAIGIFFAVSMALGVIFIGLRKRYTPEVFGYLFGSVLAVSWTDVAVIAAVAVFVLGVIALLFKEWCAFAFDEVSAQVSGLPVRLLYYGMLTLLALTIVQAVKVVGVILVSAFLVIPGSFALSLSQRFVGVVVWSVALGAGSVVVGLMLSNTLDLPSGATIVLVQFVAFLTVQLRNKMA